MNINIDDYIKYDDLMNEFLGYGISNKLEDFANQVGEPVIWIDNTPCFSPKTIKAFMNRFNTLNSINEV